MPINNIANKHMNDHKIEVPSFVLVEAVRRDYNTHRIFASVFLCLGTCQTFLMSLRFFMLFLISFTLKVPYVVFD